MKHISRFLLQAGIVLSLLFSPFSASSAFAAADDINVSGITTPSAANGTYTRMGTQFGYSYWSLVSGGTTYYIYNDTYPSTGTTRYWNIDNDLNDENTVLFYSSSSSDPYPYQASSWIKDTALGFPTITTGALTSNIIVSGNGINISSGSDTISSANYTNIGSVNTPGGTASRTFTISNTGSAELTLSGSSPYVTISGTNAANFTISQVPGNSISASTGSTQFAITFTPSAEGYANADVTINSNDPDTPVYTFKIQGYCFVPRDIVLSGVTSPGDVNGKYVHQGVFNSFQYWKHESKNYYIYSSIFSGSSYWNIDDDKNSTNVLFYRQSEDGSPVGLTGWSIDTGHDPKATGIPSISYAIAEPEINIKGNSVSIISNDSTPSFHDHTNFGAVETASGSRTRTYTIENIGGANLTISSVTLGGADAGEFSKTNPVATTIAGASSTTFTVTFNPSTEGTKSATVSIVSNDSDESTYQFELTGFGVVPKNLTVTDILTPAAANGTYIYQGILFENQCWKHESQEYYIYNHEFVSGSTSTFYWNIDSNQIDTDDDYLFYNTSEAGVPVGLTSWQANNVAGHVTSGVPVVNYSGPEMDVRGNGNTVVDGSSSPATSNYTDFGSVGVASGTASHSFTIANTGLVDLTLSGTPKVVLSGTNAGDFSVTTQPTSPVAATTGTTTFTVEFNPSGAGTRSAAISIANDDTDENPYNFNIQGTGVTTPTLTTSAAASITGAGATLGGNVTSDGGASVTARGVVYSTSNSNPEIGGANVTQDTNGSGTGVFSEAITGLAVATHYYFQAYATNTEGTTYGGVQEFTTLNAITSINRVGSSPTKGSSVSWTVEFGAALTGLTASNFSLVNSGLTGPAITGVTGSGTTWTVTADTGTGSGTLGLNFVNATGLSQGVGNPLPYSGQTYTIDKTAPSAPTITGISSGIFNSDQTFTVSGEAGATIEYTTNLGGLWTVYSGPVTLSAEGTYKIVACQTDQAGNGPTATSIYTITIDKTAPSAPTISGISAGYFNSNQTFTVSGEAGNTIEYSTNNGGLWTVYSGAVTLSSEGTYNVLARQTDQAGNGPVASSVITLTIDKTAPTVAIIQAAGQADPAGSAPVNFTVTFNEDVTGFATGDVDLSVSTAPGTLAGTVSGGPAVYNVAVSGMTGDGVIIALIAAGVAQDAAGNASTIFSTADNIVTYDSVSPGVTINQAAGQIDPTNAGPIHFTVVFTERVTGFATGDVTLTSALAGLTQTILETAPNNGTTFDVSVGGLSGGGTVTASIAAGVATDAAAHGNMASTSTDNVVTFDTAAPATTINTHPTASTTSTSATFTFSATDAGTGVAGFQCQLDAGGFNACTSPRDYTGLSGGSHSFMVRATDAIGNTETPPQTFSWTVDASAPVVTAFTVTSPSTSQNIPVTAFTATDDIGVTGFMMTQSSTAPAAGSKSWAGSAPAYFNVIADGTYTVYPWVKDAAGRVSAVFSTPRTIIVDSTAPTVTINQASGQADPVKAGPVTFTAVFSEPVTGFDASDVIATASTAPGAAIGTVTGGPTVFTITANATGEGAIVVSIPAGSAQDAITNPNTASTSTDNSVTLDRTNPAVVIDNITPDPTNTGATVTWHSNENGTYSVRVGGTDCVTGTQVTSATYSTSPATLNSVIPSANLAAGVNTVRVCVTDGAANNGSTSDTVTKVLTPIVTTTAATAIGNAAATLHGTVNANGSSTTVKFEYGLDATYGTTVDASPASITGSSNTNVSAAITGLTANTTYHYRVTASNLDGTTNGTDQTFTTTDLSISLAFHTDTHTPPVNPAIGDTLHVQATVTHSNPAAPTGSLVFTRYNNVACYGTGTPAGTLAIAATVDPSQGGVLTGNGLSFKARYAGDSTYPAAESPCARISTTADLSILPESTGTSPRDGITITGGLNSLVVQFNSDVLHNNPTDGNSVLNPLNFLLVSRGVNNVFDTVNCAGGVVVDDSAVTVDSVSYNEATYTATVNVNGGTRLPVGYYRLFVCGTTSITDPARAVFLNGHADDSRISFRVSSGSGSSSSSSSDDAENVKRLPATGFKQGGVTILPAQTTGYSETDSLRLEIPRLGLETSIVGVPVSNDGAAWDVTWLGREAGWLNGTAFPSFAGNSVITGHVWDADNQPGIFVNLKDLAYGDKVTIHAYGWAYTYEVRETTTVAPDAVKAVIKHEDSPWLTLVTCEDYDTGKAEYGNRRVVRAVLVNVTEE